MDIEAVKAALPAMPANEVRWLYETLGVVNNAYLGAANRPLCRADGNKLNRFLNEMAEEANELRDAIVEHARVRLRVERGAEYDTLAFLVLRYEVECADVLGVAAVLAVSLASGVPLAGAA